MCGATVAALPREASRESGHRALFAPEARRDAHFRERGGRRRRLVRRKPRATQTASQRRPAERCDARRVSERPYNRIASFRGVTLVFTCRHSNRAAARAAFRIAQRGAGGGPPQRGCQVQHSVMPRAARRHPAQSA